MKTFCGKDLIWRRQGNKKQNRKYGYLGSHLMKSNEQILSNIILCKCIFNQSRNKRNIP